MFNSPYTQNYNQQNQFSNSRLLTKSSKMLLMKLIRRKNSAKDRTKGPLGKSAERDSPEAIPKSALELPDSLPQSA